MGETRSEWGPIHWACRDCGAWNVAAVGAPTYPATCAGCGVRWALCPNVDCWCDLDDCPICSGEGLVREFPAVRAAVAA